MRNTRTTPVLGGLCFLVLVLGAAALGGYLLERRPVEIPLSEIYSTDRQGNLKSLNNIDTSNFRKGLVELYKTVIESERANKNTDEYSIFLARASDIQSAIFATWAALTRNLPTKEPVRAEVDDKSDELWLVLFLFGSSTPQFEIASVQKDNAKIRVTLKPPPMSITADYVPYFFWIPVGKLAPGQYRLEVVREGNEKPVLQRTVSVP